MMKLVHQDTDRLLSEHVYQWVGWRPAYQQDRPKTITGVSVLPHTAVLELEADVTFMFSEHWPTSTVADMYDFWEMANHTDIFEFTDLSGESYEVQVAEPPESSRIEDLKNRSIYLNKLILLRVGFIR